MLPLPHRPRRPPRELPPWRPGGSATASWFWSSSFHFNYFIATIRPWCLTFLLWWASTANEDKIADSVWAHLGSCCALHLVPGASKPLTESSASLKRHSAYNSLQGFAAKRNFDASRNKHGPMPNAQVCKEPGQTTNVDWPLETWWMLNQAAQFDRCMKTRLSSFFISSCGKAIRKETDLWLARFQSSLACLCLQWSI